MDNTTATVSAHSEHPDRAAPTVPGSPGAVNAEHQRLVAQLTHAGICRLLRQFGQNHGVASASPQDGAAPE